MVRNEVIRYHKVPIGLLTEEPQEGKHKECRYLRLNNTRKSSREETLLDLFVMLFVSSNPLVSAHRNLGKKYKRRSRDEERDFETALGALLLPLTDDLQAAMTVLQVDSDFSAESFAESALENSDVDGPVRLKKRRRHSEATNFPCLCTNE